MSRKNALTQQQLHCCAVRRMTEVIRAALAGCSLTGLDVALTGVEPEELCHPLTKEQIGQIRACVSQTRQTVEAEYIPDERAEATGVVLFHVRYDVAGYDADGNAVDVAAEGAIGVGFRWQGGAFGHEVMAILDVERCKLMEDGTVKRPGWLERRLRRSAREARRDHHAGTVGEFLLEALGAVVEFVLDLIFDG